MGLIITIIVGIGAAIIFSLAHYNRCLDDIEEGDTIERARESNTHE